ncbi:hypothetical protein ACC740_36915, partial [Rhizobium ruizarguesonis]
LPVGIETAGGEMVNQEILYPSNPGSIYHMTKCLDQLLFQFYASNDGLRITDLHQGIVWGTHTEQTRRLDEEAVQHRAVIAVIVETVDKRRVAAR